MSDEENLCSCPPSDTLEGEGHVSTCAHMRPGDTRRALSAPQTSPATIDATSAKAPPIDAPQVRSSRPPPVRERLPEERPSITRTFRLKYTHQNGEVDEVHLYFTAGMYPDGRPGEVFVTADKGGTLARGALDMVGIFISLLLQHGISIEAVIDKMKGTRFPPASFTGDSQIPNCSSVLDLLAKWLELKFLPEETP